MEEPISESVSRTRFMYGESIWQLQCGRNEREIVIAILSYLIINSLELAIIIRQKLRYIVRASYNQKRICKLGPCGFRNGISDDVTSRRAIITHFAVEAVYRDVK